ncbi:MAG: FtsX-like permease family protein [Vicinamibacterales bacterium]
MRIDLLHLSRHLRRSPMSALAAIVTLALTFGTAASVFAVVDAVLLTPPPFAEPERLFTVGEVPIDESAAAAPRAVTYATFERWRDRAGALASFEAFDGTNLTLTEVGPAERLQVTDATPGFLRQLGVSAAMGRTFAADDVGRSVAIVSDEFWRGKLAADPNIIGRELVLGGRSHTVIGVLPERFVFALGRADIWRPLAAPPDQAGREDMRVRVIARVNSEATSSQLVAILDDVSGASRPPSRVVARDVATAIAGDRTATIRLLAGAASVALLIAFANLAGLLIVRSIDRRRELAVRTALGAGPSETTRQLVLESSAIVAVGALAGVLLAWRMTPIAADLILERVGEFATREVSLNWRVVGGLVVVSLGCAVTCGWLPALAATRWNPVDVLRRGVTPSRRELTVRRAFVAGEVTLAFVLLVSMSLLGKSLSDLLQNDPGFEPEGVVALQISLPGTSYPSDERVAAFYSALQSTLRDRFGAGSAAIVDELPLTGSGGRRLVGLGPDDAGREAIVRSVGTDYFDVMRIPVIAGRSFDSADGAGSQLQVVISQSLAARAFASGSPLGQRLWVAEAARVAEIVGVVADVKHRTLDEAAIPTVYLSSAQAPSNSSVVVVRSERQAADVIATVREEVASLDPALPVYRVRSMADVIAASPGLPSRQMMATTFTGLALLALVLSAIGLFGVAAHDVACRRTELALRTALGADPMRILTATIGRGVLTVVIGLAVGAVLSIWAARALGGVSADVARADVLPIVVVAALLLATGIGAVLPAALRAARTDPRMVLHSE